MDELFGLAGDAAKWGCYALLISLAGNVLLLVVAMLACKWGLVEKKVVERVMRRVETSLDPLAQRITKDVFKTEFGFDNGKKGDGSLEAMAVDAINKVVDKKKAPESKGKRFLRFLGGVARFALTRR